jgi:hypothetical protein
VFVELGGESGALINKATATTQMPVDRTTDAAVFVDFVGVNKTIDEAVASAQMMADKAIDEAAASA